VHELAQEQGIADRLLVAGSAESVVGIRRQGLAHEPGGGLFAQGSRLNHGGQRVGDDLDQQAWILSWIPLPEADDDREAKGAPRWPGGGRRSGLR
jgi:hypothetical protein